MPKFLIPGRGLRSDLLLLLVCVTVAYGLSLTAHLIGDDFILLKNAREATWSFSDLSRTFDLKARDISDGWLPASIENFRLYFFRPLCMATFKLDLALWGTWWPGHHLTNVLLQLGVVLTLYLWAADFGFDRRARFLTGFLFVFYVPNLLAVNWLSGRTELLSALFIVFSIYLLGRFHQTSEWWAYTGSFAAFVLGLGSKENAVLIPFFHILAARFIYRDHAWDRGLSRTALAVLPFLLTLPAYFALRSWALDGFPVPESGHYYHRPGDENFWPFLITKLTYTVVALVYQIPSMIGPIVFERSIAAMAILIPVAMATAVAFIVWLRPPLRYFLLGWVAFALAPTLPITINPVYYYLPSVAMVVTYVSVYTRFTESPIAWRRKAARWCLVALIIIGIGTVPLSGPGLAWHWGSTVQGAEDAIAILDEAPEADRVYILDTPPNMQYLAPAARLLAPRHADVEYIFLNIGTGFLFGRASEIEVVDANTFRSRAPDSSYFTTGFSNAILNEEQINFYPGKTQHGDGYVIEVVEVVEKDAVREEAAILELARKLLNFPPETQPGVKTLEYRFERPLSSPRNVFVQIDGREAKPLEFGEEASVGDQ